MKLPHVNKKPLLRNRIFVQTPFSHYFKIRAKKNSRRKTTRFFAPFPVSAWPKSLLQFDFKYHENEWTDLKKKTAPQYNSNSLNCKKQEKTNNSPSYRCAAIKKNEILPLSFKIVLFGVQFQLDSKTILNSSSKLKATLMSIDNSHELW